MRVCEDERRNYPEKHQQNLLLYATDLIEDFRRRFKDSVLKDRMTLPYFISDPYNECLLIKLANALDFHALSRITLDFNQDINNQMTLFLDELEYPSVILEFRNLLKPFVQNRCPNNVLFLENLQKLCDQQIAKKSNNVIELFREKRHYG